MKKILLTLLLVAFLAAPSFAADNTNPGVVNSVHDLSIGSGGGGMSTTITTTEVRVCAFCHTPHHAIASVDYAPLWSHETPDAIFTQYSSPTFEGVTGGDSLRGGSRLCMGCHDGQTAPDAYYGDTVGSLAAGTDDWDDFGIGEGLDLTNDHPVGFSYGDAIIADAAKNGGSMQFRLVTEAIPSDIETGAGINTVANLLRADDTDDDLVTCASCHDVHNSVSVNQEISAQFSGIDVKQVQSEKYLLYGSQVDSVICRMCHVK